MIIDKALIATLVASILAGAGPSLGHHRHHGDVPVPAPRPRGIGERVTPDTRTVTFFPGCSVVLINGRDGPPSYDASGCTEGAMRAHYCPAKYAR